MLKRFLLLIAAFFAASPASADYTQLLTATPCSGGDDG
jgi:hypothetical protein